MRIFIASGIFHPESGGPATYLHHLLPALQSRGHEITVITFGDVSSQGYPYSLARIPRGNYFKRQWQYYTAASRLWGNGHDLAYLHTLGLPLPGRIRPRIAKIVGDVAWERAMNKGWIPANTDIDTFQTARFSLQVEIDKSRRAAEARKLDQIIVPSEYLRCMVLGWGIDPKRVRVIYNALDEPINTERIDQAEARSRLGLPDAPTLITAARLTPWKGIDHTLRALAKISNPQMRFLVAGDGPELESLQQLASELSLTDQVMWLGRVSRDQMPLYFQAADYKVLYSGYEGLPHVLLEALTVGTPVIASEKGGNPEVITHGVNGLLVPYINVDALAETIRLAFEPGKRASLAAHAHINIERFSIERLIDETEAVLKEVAGD